MAEGDIERVEAIIVDTLKQALPPSLSHALPTRPMPGMDSPLVLVVLCLLPTWAHIVG